MGQHISLFTTSSMSLGGQFYPPVIAGVVSPLLHAHSNSETVSQKSQMTRETLVHQPLSSPDAWTTHAQLPGLFRTNMVLNPNSPGALLPRSLFIPSCVPGLHTFSPVSVTSPTPIHSFIFIYSGTPARSYSTRRNSTHSKRRQALRQTP